MDITYTEEKRFTKDEVQRLFRSVHWISAEYPERLHKALMHSQTVITAWDGARLVGLCRVIDDSEMNVKVAQSLGIQTLCPHNNEDWTVFPEIQKLLNE